MAWLVAHGQIPYRDYFDHHPPLFHLLFALPVRACGDSLVSLFVGERLIALIALCVTLALFSRLTHSRAMISGWAACLLIVTRSSDILVMLRPDCLAIMFILAAALLMVTANSSSLWKPFTAGLCLGLAMLFTQKILALAPAFVLWQIIKVWREESGQRKRELLNLLLLLIGLALPLIAMLTWLWREGALTGFMAGPIGFGASWNQPDGFRHFNQEPLLLGFWIISIGIGWSFQSAWRWISRSQVDPVDSLIGLIAIFGMIGYISTPAPTPQAWLLTSHIWLVAACVRCAAVWWEGESKPLSKASLLTAVSVMVLLLNPLNALAAVILWGGVMAFWIRLDGTRRRKWLLTALAGVSIVAFVLTQADRCVKHIVLTQITTLQQIQQLVNPGDQALTTWPVLTPLRPHANYHWFSDIGMYTSLPSGILHKEYSRALKDPRTAVVAWPPDVIRKYMPDLEPLLKQYFRKLPVTTKAIFDLDVWGRK